MNVRTSSWGIVPSGFARERRCGTIAPMSSRRVKWRKHMPIATSRATELLRLHLGRVAAMAEAIGCGELTNFLGS